MNPIRIASLLVAALFTAAPALRAQTPDPGATVVYLVRHAERAEDGTNDPPLSVEGEARARLLAGMLADAGIGRIHTTPYRRTRDTAAPVAERLGLEVETYDASDLPGLAGRLRAEGGRHLVVGHSNTTPAAVAAFGGDGGGPIGEFEYDRLYVLTLSEAGATTVLLRFGAPPPGP